MKTLTRILSSFSLILVMAFSARSQDVFKVAPVGIGTANPAQALDVEGGNIRFTGALMPNNNAGLTGNILLSGGASPNFPTWLANGVTGQVLTATGTGVVYKAGGYWNLTGNAGTSPGVNYVGTNDDQPIYFYSASPYAGNSGSLDPNYENSGATLKGNVYFGTPNGNNGVGGAGNTDAGTLNVAFGFGSMGNNSSSATGNVAMGDHSNAHNGGNYNIALGGLLPLWNNYSASGNIAIGGESFSYADGGYQPGNDNTAIGYLSMDYYVGSYNASIGYYSLLEPDNVTTTGTSVSNTAIGTYAAYYTYANRNVALGDSALYTNTTGESNTALGYGADATTNYTNAIAIGYKATAPVSNSVTLGNTSSNALYLPGFNTIGSLYYTSSAITGQVLGTGSGTSGYLLESNGPGVAPTWANITPSSGTVTSMTGTAPMIIAPATTWLIGIQGTGANSGGVLYSAGGGTSALFTSTGTAGQLLQYNGPGAPTWVANPNALVWNIGGNILSGAYGANFIGTLSGSTSPQLEFKGTSQSLGVTGLLDPINQNVYFGGVVNGDWTGDVNTNPISGSIDNVAIGNSAMGGSVSGTSNDVFIGYAAGLPFSCVSLPGAPNAGGNGDAIVGDDALRWYTSGGVPNTALGVGAINGNIGAGGTNNIGVGYSANGVHTSGLKDVALGAYSLGANTTTSNNTAAGYYANEIGTGTGNSAIGYYSLEASSGSFNTGVGYEALLTNTSGSNNTGIGANANVSSGALTNATAIGYTASATLSNSVFVGNSAVAFNSITGAGLYLPHYNAPNSLYYISAANGQVASTGTGTSGYLLVSNGPGAAPTWNNVSLAVGAVTNVTGVAPIVVTGGWTVGIQDPSNNKGGILYSLGGGTAAAYTSAGTSGQILQSNGAGVPTWITPVISAANDWLLTGNAISSTYGANYLGTLNASGAGPQLEFKTNNAYSGVLDPVNNNVYFGNQVNNFWPGGDVSVITPGVTNNVAIGFGAFGGLTASGDNIASGTSDNVYIGYVAGYNSSVAGGGVGSTGIGYGSLRNATGAPNTGFGFFTFRTSGGSSEPGANNTAIGYESQYSYTTALRNVSIGFMSLYTNSTGSNNTAAGYEPLYTNSTGSNNTAVGYETLHASTTASGNTAVGYFALETNAVAQGRNVALGANTMSVNSSNGQDVVIGTNAAHSLGTSYGSLGSDVVIGDSAFYTYSGEALKAVAIGYHAMGSQSSSATLVDVAVGFNAMQGSTASLYTTAIGTNALLKATTSSYSTIIGAGAALGGSTTLGSEVIAIGTGAMGSTLAASTMTGTYNIAIGSTTGIIPYTANSGTISAAALPGATLGSLTSGAENVAIGYGAGNALTTGPLNVLVGYNAAATYGTGTGEYGVAIGANTLLPTTLTNLYNIAVGYAADAANLSKATADNYYNIALGGNDTAGVITIASTYSFYNIGIGANANASPTSTTSDLQANSSLAIGYQARARAQDAVAIGANAFANTANTIILGSIAGINGATSGVSVGINTATPAQELEIGTLGTIRVDGLGSTGTIYDLAQPSLLTDQILFARSSGDLYSMPQGANGQELVLNSSNVPSWGYPSTSFTASSPLSFVGNGPQNLVLSGTSGGVLYGTASSPTPGGVAFTAAGAVDSILGVNGSLVPTFVNANASGGPNDNWGTQSVVTDSLLTHGVENTITGNGLPGSPLKLSQQGAAIGQTLAWNGTSWVPTVASTYTVGTTYNITSPGIITLANNTNRVVGGSNVTLDVQGTAGGVLAGNGTGSSATFTAAGTSGQVLTSNGALPPSYQALPAAATWHLWSLTGNSGTTPGVNYIGTNDDHQFRFYSGSPYAGPAGSIDPQFVGATAYANTYLGDPNGNNSNYGGAGNSDAGSYNVAFGFGCMGFAQPTSTYNVAMGSHAYEGWNSSISGSYNVGIGEEAIDQNFKGSYEVAVGGNALNGTASSATSNYNSAIGFESLFGGNSSGTAYYGSYNTALGYYSLYTPSAGGAGSNTAMGTYSEYQSTGGRNSVVGDSALYTNTTGEYNSAIGYDANVSSNSLTNATPVGALAYASTSNTLVLGQISGVNGATNNTTVAIGTNAPSADAALAIKKNHIESQGQLAAGNVFADAGAGSGATSTISSATDVGGSISFTSGSSGFASGPQVTVLFGNPYSYSPVVSIAPANAAAATAMTTNGAYVSEGATSFTINFNTAPSAGQTFKFNYFIIETPGVLPSDIPCNVPITLTNNQSTATPTGFQQMLTVNSSTYSSLEMPGLQNVEFTVGSPAPSGTPLQAWIESGNTSTSTGTIYWVNLGSHTISASGGTLVIYLNFMSSSVMSATGPTGEAPQLSLPLPANYGLYDNGSYVFGTLATFAGFYDNFKGSTVNAWWTQIPGDGVTIAQSNGITFTTGGSSTYGGVVLTNGYSSATAQIFDGDVTTVSGIAAGMGLNLGILATSGCYNYSYWGDNPYTDGGGSVAYGTFAAPGQTATNNPNITIEPGIDGGAWLSASTQTWYSPYPSAYTSYAGTQTAEGFPSTIYPSLGEYYSSNGSIITFQWVRTHLYAPSGVMPTAAYGTTTCSGPSQPSETNVCYVPVTLHNSTSSATPSNYPQLVTVNSSLYSSLESAGLQNVEFSTGPGGTGTLLQAWLESGNTTSSTTTVWWVNMGSNTIAAGNSLTIYMNFMTSNVMSALGPTGEAPQLSGTYAQYDNGATVFPTFYDNFAGISLASKWTSDGFQTVAVNNGVTLTYVSSNWNAIYTNTFSAALNNVADVYVEASNPSGTGACINTSGTNGNGVNNGTDGVDAQLDGPSGTGFAFGTGGSCTTAPNANTTYANSAPVANTFYALSFYMLSTPVLQINYGAFSTVTGTGVALNAISPTSAVGLGVAQSSTGTYQWFRIRPTLANSSTVPSVSLGEINCL